MKVSYISLGKLFVSENGGEFRHVESQFAQEVLNKEIIRHQKKEWKKQSRSDNNLLSGARLWNVADEDPVNMKLDITGITHGGAEDVVIYSMETDRMGGLFLYDIKENSEKRLYHKEKMFVSDLARHKSDPIIAFSMRQFDGISNIVLAEQDKPVFREVTSGDSCDESPSWIPAKKNQLVYQSRGIGRNQNGLFICYGPSTVEKLDMESGSLETLVSDQKYDFLLPKAAVNGDLYMIRRPYEETFGKKYGIVDTLKDIIMFPFRLLDAFFHFLNFFSVMWSNKTLTSKPLKPAGGPGFETPDLKSILIRGRYLEVKIAKNGEKESAPTLVPDSWELIKQSAGGQIMVLAKGIAAYDLLPDGGVVYSDGSTIYKMDNNGKKEKIGKGKYIQNIAVFM